MQQTTRRHLRITAAAIPQPPRHTALPRGSVTCRACWRPTLAPVPIGTDPTKAGPERVVYICDGCARSKVTEHRAECGECRADRYGPGCKAAWGAARIIEDAAAARRAARTVEAARRARW